MDRQRDERAMTDREMPVRVGLKLKSRRAAREIAKLVSGGDKIGVVTSGTFSPTLNQSISMAYVAPKFAASGTAVEVDIRGTKMARKSRDCRSIPANRGVAGS